MASAGPVYSELTFPLAPADRPYTFINMVATIDGKTVSGTRTEPVGDLGSEADHQTLRQIEEAADAILIGAGNLRSTLGLWYPKEKIRIVASRSGKLDYGSRFFTDAPDKAMVMAPTEVEVPAPHKKLPDNFRGALARLRHEFGVERLLVEGGSDLNGDFLREDLADELFLTVAPKIKLGECLPTYAGGEALRRDQLLPFTLLEVKQVGDEVFLRYRRKWEK